MKADAGVIAVVPADQISAYHSKGERSVFEHIARMSPPEAIVYWETTLPGAGNDRFMHSFAIVAACESEEKTLDLVTAVNALKIGASPSEFYFNPGSLLPTLTKASAPIASRRTSQLTETSSVDYLHIQISFNERC